MNVYSTSLHRGHIVWGNINSNALSFGVVLSEVQHYYNYNIIIYNDNKKLSETLKYPL